MRNWILPLGIRATAVVVGASLGACSPASGPKTGTQTNWLKLCESNADCGDLSCVCGACTVACDRRCADLPDASCVADDDAGAIALCGGREPPVGGLCLQRCTDTDCPVGTACEAEVCVPLREPTAVVEVDVSAEYQTLVGFGAGVAYADDTITEHPAKQALYDALFDESGFDVVRLRNRYDDGGDGNLASAAEIVEAATERLGTTPTLFMNSASPPGSLKANGDTWCAGNPDTCTLATLPDGSFDYPGLASHWRASLEAYAAVGIEPDYIGIQNDPDWVPPASTELEACRFAPTERTETVDMDGNDVEVAYPGLTDALAAVHEAVSDLPSAPRIVAPETTEIDSTLDYVSELDLTTIDAIAHHMYGTDPSSVDRDALLALNEIGQRNGLPIFQTEMQAEGLETAILMHEALSAIGASVYLQNDFVASPGVDVPAPNALVALSDEDFTLQDPYYAMRHYARHTGAGWVRVDARSDEANVLATAWLSPDQDELTVVLVNPEPEEQVVELALGESTPLASEVIRTVFPGVERSAELGALPAQNVVVVPGEAVVTVALRR